MQMTKCEWVDLYVAPGDVATHVYRVTNCPPSVLVCFDENDVMLDGVNVVLADGSYKGSTVERAFYGSDVLLVVRNPNVSFDDYAKVYPHGLPKVSVRAADGERIVSVSAKNISIAWPRLSA